MAKKTARQRAVKRCDTAFSLYIRERDNYTCYTCGAVRSEDTVIECGHLISRGKAGTRWDVTNANAQCRSCNNRHEHYPEVYTERWIKEHGQAAYEALVRKAWEPRKFSVDEIEMLARTFKGLIRG